MARVTVEDCLDFVDNRFELVLLASRRARQLEFSRESALVPIDNDKPTVLALREIAAGLLSMKNINDVQKRKEDKEDIV